MLTRRHLLTTALYERLAAQIVDAMIAADTSPA